MGGVISVRNLELELLSTQVKNLKHGYATRASYCIVVLSYTTDSWQSLNIAGIMQHINPFNKIPDDTIAVLQY